MAQNNPQLPWTDEQWDRVQEVIGEEARKARVAASFLPTVGPLPPDTDYVSMDTLSYEPPAGPRQRILVTDTETTQFCTLEIRIYLRGPQVADPDLTSALQMFRRAANTLARIEDAIVFRGRSGNQPGGGVAGLRSIWTVSDSGPTDGLSKSPAQLVTVLPPDGEGLVSAVSEAIGRLESAGHLGPFACVLDQALFKMAQTPTGSLVLPQDRILPFLDGGPLLRSSTLDRSKEEKDEKDKDKKSYPGVVVALGGAPIDLVLAKDISLSFLQVDLEPRFVFRVYEKLALRIKEKTAIVGLVLA